MCLKKDNTIDITIKVKNTIAILDIVMLIASNILTSLPNIYYHPTST